jgi:Raf kinase inhibitor-like YbhB/YbcL family protein
MIQNCFVSSRSHLSAMTGMTSTSNRTGVVHLMLLLLPLLLISCSDNNEKSAAEMEIQEETIMTLQISSPAFEDGAAIPQKYSCDGDDMSPAVYWSELPDQTESIALIMDDPDAPVGTWVHWVLYDLPGNRTEIPENAPKSDQLPSGGTQGSNSWGRSGYGGPCPPGGTHRYFFKLYALDALLDLASGATKEELLQAMEGHILDQGQLMGTYTR